MDYLTVKWLRVLSSTVLFGTDVGLAYCLLFTSLTRDPRPVASVARLVVIADWGFTATTVILQPVTGVYMAHLARLPLATPWLLWSIVLYAVAVAVAVACWLPVVWLQLRMHRLAKEAVRQGTALPQRYFRYLKAWTALGVPAFLAFLGVFWLMVAKPSL